MRLSRRTILAGAVASVAMPHIARAAWPDRQITLVHGFAPGGNADVLARVVADHLPKRIGQSVVVEARPGAGGTTAAQQVSRSAPDGYTLMIVVAGHAVYPTLYRSLAFDPVDDFSFISMLAEYPFIVATHPDHLVTTPADLIAAARERADPMTYGTAGNGTGQHLSMALFASRAGIALQHIPYRGNTNGTTDLLARRIDFMIEAPASLLSHIRSGSLRAVGVTAPQRFFALPDVPTLAEGGVPDYAVTSWSGLGAPANLPSTVVQRLNTEIHSILAEPDVIESLHRFGNAPAPTSPEAFRARVARDIAKWSEAGKAAGLQQI